VQFFQPALLNPDRRGEAHGALSGAGQHYAAILQAKKTTIVLRQLFQNLDTTVSGQEPVVLSGEYNALNTHENLEHGNLQTDRAIDSVGTARKGKWMCLGIFVVSVLMIATIIVVWAYVTGRFVS
jgi:t-SNARE complex subunit (syntaxin)